MIPMLDMRAERILELQNQTGLELLQLRTPLTRYASRNHLHYGVDNGAYSGFQERKFLSLVDECVEDPYCMWINLPDVFGSARATTALFHEYCFYPGLNVQNRCYTVQDGITPEMIPWQYITAVFIGGTTKFKMGKIARAVARGAMKRKKWVHVGRINTPRRIDSWYNDADSFDGSGVSKYTHMFNAAIHSIRNNQEKPQGVI
tara:strand:+ start:1075 stop:1683 length:609 start_codon:yes stop_codon:yes gene_type:complete